MTNPPDSTRPWLPVVLALAALALVWLRFAPPLVEWRALDSPAYYNLPATHRAWYVMQQVDDPFLAIDNVSNRVVRWRLLLPVLTGIVPGVPPGAVLALAMLGVAVAVGYWAHLLARRGLSPPFVFAATVLFAGCGGILTGLHWLSYADGWILAGLLAVAAGGRRTVLIAAVCCPWIDERFVLLAPLALLIRGFDATPDEAPAHRNPTVVAVAAGCGVYLAVRGIATLSGNDLAGDYLGRMATDWRNLGSPTVLAQALWHSLRLLWVPVIFGAVTLLRNRSPRRQAIAAAIIIWSILVNVLLAGDLSRSLSFLAILALPGFVAADKAWPRLRQFLPILATLQLLLPIAHVGLGWHFPARTIVQEASRLRHPPAFLTGSHHLDLAVKAMQANDPAAARALARAATKLTPDDPKIAAGAQAVLDRTTPSP